MMKKYLLGLLILGAASTGLVNACCPSTSCNTSCNTSCSTSCNTSCSTSCGTSCGSSCDTGCSTSCSSSRCCGCPDIAKTYMFVRPLYQSVRPELLAGFWNDVMVEAQEGWGGAIDLVVFGGKSTKNLAPYFLPSCKNCLSATAALQNPVTADLDAQNFNIRTLDTSFSSTACFCASHNEVGLGVHWKQGFWFNCDRTKWWYLDINFPITSVKNTFNINEVVGNAGGGVDTALTFTAAGNLTQAFAQSSWCYGRIDNCCKKQRTGVADIELKFGRQFMFNEHCNVAGYLGFLIPTGNTPKGRVVFEPIVGHGGSWAVMWGSIGGYEIWNNCDESWHLNLNYALHSQYLFNKKQVRSFDLKNKPWSRYQEMYANLAQAEAAAALVTTSPASAALLATPGINLLTRCVKVKPGYQVNMTGALQIENECGFEAELGYNFYARQAECLSGLNFVSGPAIKGQFGLGETNPYRTIAPSALLADIFNPLAAYNNSLILASDIDLASASTPAVISNIVYGHIGYRWMDRCMPINIGLGGSYEFATDKNLAAVDRWTVWGKFGVAF